MQNDKLKQFLEKIKKQEEEKRVIADTASSIPCANETVRERNVSDDNEQPYNVRAGKVHNSHKYVYEDKSRRMADVRTYRKENGKLEAVITGAPVNYYNRAEKRYRQIDNTLERRGNTRNSMDFIGYENRYNSFKVRFAETTASSDMMRVEKDGYEIYFKLLTHDLLISDGNIYNRGFREVQATIGQSANDNLTSKVKYADLYDGIDFDYEIRPDSIKEDITVKSRRDSYTFAFKVFTNGLDIRLSEDGKEIRFIASVSLEDTSEGDTVFTMPAAFMYDKANNKSENIIYAVDYINNGEFLLKVIPDSNWLNADERTFPVVIDPSILVFGDDSDIVYKVVKNFVSHSSGSDFYKEENNNVKIGFFRGNASESDAAKMFGETELYIGFKNISRIYNGLVNVAQINIPIYLPPYVKNTAGYFEVHGITAGADWMNKELTWDTRPQVGSEIIAFAKPIHEVEDNELGGWYLKLDITSAMAAKYSGFVVKGSTKGVFFNGGWYNYIYIPNTNIKQNVSLSIVYTEKEHVRGGKSIQQSCNQAGTGFIDLFTGDILFVHDDFNLEGVQLPINIAHIYNSRLYDKEADETYKCGSGWRLNFLQTLKEKYEEIGAYNDDINFKCFEYIDASGIRHELTTKYYNELQSTDDKKKKFKIYSSYRKEDEKNPDNKDPVDWTGTEISDGTLVLNLKDYAITDENNNKFQFDLATGRLIKITNADGNFINITYSSNNSTVTITDENNRSVTLHYSARKLTSIEAGGNTINYTYQTIAGISCLTKISGDFGDTLFSYNAKGILCKVTDPSGYIVEYKTSDSEGYICGGYKVKCKNKEISYNANEKAGAIAGTEQLLDDVTVTYNAEFCAEVTKRFNGLYFTQAVENMTMVENAVGAKKFYSFSNGGVLMAAFDDKLSQEVCHVSNREAPILKENLIDADKPLDSDRWKRSVITQTNASVLSTAQVLNSASSRDPIGGNYASTPDFLDCGSYEYLDEGGYVFTAIIVGNIMPGQTFIELSDKEAKSTSYVVLKVVRHFNNKADDVQFIRVEPDHSGGTTEKLTSLPFIVDNDVTSVDLSVEINNSPEYLTVTYWDLVPAAKASMVVAHDKDYSESTSYSGKYGTKSKSDLSKRGTKKQTTTTRTGSVKSITSVDTYLSEDSEKITEQDDGISLVRKYSYNSGNVVAEEVSGRNSDSPKMKKEYSYEKSGSKVNGNALFSETDESGNKTTYDYEPDLGLLSRTTLPGTNQNIDYAYSGTQGLLKEIKALANSSKNVEETSNSFYYNLGYLTRVKHNSCTYDFTYDGFGRITKVTVGGNTIIRSAYTQSGTNIDGVEGATSKTVTAYYNQMSSDTADVLAKCMTYCGNLFCGQFFATADEKEGQVDVTFQSNVYASYYNKFGELIKVRHALNCELDDPLNSDNDYITVSDECEYYSETRVLTYVVGTTKYVYNYDRTTGELIDSTEYENNVEKIKYGITEYDKYGRQKTATFTLDSEETMAYTYMYKSDYEDSVKVVKLPNNVTSIFETDELGRLTQRTVSNVVLSTKYEYCNNKNNATYTTPLVSKETHSHISSKFAVYQYTYDSNNNILTVKDASDALLVSYEYDGLNRLIRENIVGGNTTVFKYDNGGNLQYKKEYTYSAATGKTYTDLLNGTGKTISYGYGISSNKDLLTSYNGSGTLEYDNYGNPKKWFKHGTGNSALIYTLQWGNVSNLISIYDGVSGSTYNYKYNDQGIRTEKVVNGVAHSYYLQGEQIIAERYGGSLIKFYYDTTGVCGFNYNGTDYYYQKNIQGDILRIFDKNGNLKAEYSYDAWGKCTIKSNVSNIATINSFRYRGYYFDSEIGLYYLNARYYDPEIGRFISPDSTEYLSPESMGGLNLYVYCGNNPVMYSDQSGCFPVLATILGIIAAAGLATVIGGVIVGSNIITAIGLTMVAIPAFIAGGIALVGGIAGGATLAAITGGVTIVAGAGTALFASAEYQQAITGNNWIKSSGMSDELYYSLMLTIATIATLGTFASSFASSFKIKSIKKIGKIDDYYGIKFTQMAKSGNIRVRTFSLHPPHNGHPWHWQLNSINPRNGSIGKKIRWDLLLRRLLGN